VPPPQVALPEAAVCAGGGAIGGRAAVAAPRGTTGVAAFPLAADGDGTVAELLELTFPATAPGIAADLVTAAPAVRDELEFTKRCDEGS
jgi:hypothetical protein